MRTAEIVACVWFAASVLACRPNTQARDERRQKVETMVSATRARAKNRSALMVSNVRAAHPKLAARGLEPCETKVSPPADEAGSPLLRSMGLDGDTTQPLGVAARALETDLRSLENAAAMDPQPEDLLTRADKVCSDTRFTWELVIVADEYLLPTAKAGADGSFATGHIKGRAYLYDYPRQVVTCVADVDVFNSARVSSSSTAEALRGDLEGEAFRSAASTLHPATSP